MGKPCAVRGLDSAQPKPCQSERVPSVSPVSICSSAGMSPTPRRRSTRRRSGLTTREASDPHLNACEFIVFGRRSSNAASREERNRTMRHAESSATRAAVLMRAWRNVNVQFQFQRIPVSDNGQRGMPSPLRGVAAKTGYGMRERWGLWPVCAGQRIQLCGESEREKKEEARVLVKSAAPSRNTDTTPVGCETRPVGSPEPPSRNPPAFEGTPEAESALPCCADGEEEVKEKETPQKSPPHELASSLQAVPESFFQPVARQFYSCNKDSLSVAASRHVKRKGTQPL